MTMNIKSTATVMVALACVFAGTGCTSSPEPTEEVSKSESKMVASTYCCLQQCADDSPVRMGEGATWSAAYQNLNGCGPGGGAIQCSDTNCWAAMFDYYW
jgi:hypothetical protein